MVEFLKNLKRDDRGATAIEYGLIVALIFVAIMGSVSTFGQEAIGIWTKISTKVSSVGGV